MNLTDAELARATGFGEGILVSLPMVAAMAVLLGLRIRRLSERLNTRGPPTGDDPAAQNEAAEANPPPVALKDEPAGAETPVAPQRDPPLAHPDCPQCQAALATQTQFVHTLDLIRDMRFSGSARVRRAVEGELMSIRWRLRDDPTCKDCPGHERLGLFGVFNSGPAPEPAPPPMDDGHQHTVCIKCLEYAEVQQRWANLVQLKGRLDSNASTHLISAIDGELKNLEWTMRQMAPRAPEVTAVPVQDNPDDMRRLDTLPGIDDRDVSWPVKRFDDRYTPPRLIPARPPKDEDSRIDALRVGPPRPPLDLTFLTRELLSQPPSKRVSRKKKGPSRKAPKPIVIKTSRPSTRPSAKARKTAVSKKAKPPAKKGSPRSG